MKRSQDRLPLDHKTRLVAIVGPTASGKSDLALELALQIDAEIICADSVTAYRGLSIGAAKPSSAEQGRVRHHMLDICEPDEQFTVADFVERARVCLEDIWSRNKTALVVGGSGLYIDALLYGFTFEKDSVDEVSPEYQRALELESLGHLQEIVSRDYPGALNQSDFQNKRRIIRTIMRGPANKNAKKNIYNGMVLGIDRHDDVLKTSISHRTKRMIEAGLVSEVQNLLLISDTTIPALQSVGYRQVAHFLQQDNTDKVELEQSINQATWRLVKKQRKWFHRNPDIQWVGGIEEALKVLSKNRYNT